MSKILKIALITIATVIVFLGAIYYFAEKKQQDLATEAVVRAKATDFEIVHEVVENRAGKFAIYYPNPNPSVQDMKDLAAYIVYEKAPDLGFIAVSVYDDKDSALLVSNPPENLTLDEKLKGDFKSALLHAICSWDSLDYKVTPGTNYKYLDGTDVRL